MTGSLADLLLVAGGTGVHPEFRLPTPAADAALEALQALAVRERCLAEDRRLAVAAGKAAGLTPSVVAHALGRRRWSLG